MQSPGAPQFSFPVPGRVLKAVLATLFAIWLVFALAGWADAGGPTFALLVGNQAAISQGQLWRLFTAPLLHIPSGSLSHILWTLLGMYFLGTSLEKSWGEARFLRFLIATAVLSYASQFVLGALLPAATASKMMPPIYFGAMPVVHAIAIAWACSFRDRTVQLMFVLPIRSSVLIWIVVGMGLLSLIAQQMPPSGHLANFAAMGWGYLLGGGTPSPLREMLLRYRLGNLRRQIEQEKKQRQRRAKKSGLTVIPGGRKTEDESDPNGKPTDKKLLN